MNYYWILSVNRKGKTVLLGPYDSEFQADRVADKLESEYRIVPLPTRDSSRATRICKERKISMGGSSLDEAGERFSHQS